ncbi:GNAT family N-acetyltransferase [Isoptericola sp. NPDC057559]|uniref:GNAT family N-acetyltransferase n=1 Tax=Isoptericola sp. NPDC057559 TaxID=3346168 RepID=UPI0036AF9AB1
MPAPGDPAPTPPPTLPADLPDGVVMRLLRRGDGPALAAAYARNRDHLTPWEPERPAAFYEADYHAERIPVELLSHGSGRSAPLVLERDGDVVGRVNLSDVVLGAFRSAHLGYWVDAALAGRGIMTAAVEAACTHARDDLALHRVQAATLLHNEASQRVLARTGFERIGTAPRYLRIAGRWQDHALFQRILHD